MIIAPILGVVLCPALGCPVAPTGTLTQQVASVESQSREMVVAWSKVLQDWAPHKRTTPFNDQSWDFDQKFEKLNGGADGSLAMVETLLKTKDQPTRRAAATVIGSIRFGVDNRPGGWPTFADKEYLLAANYVLDRDAQTAGNAAQALVDLQGGQAWNGWNKIQPKLLRAVQTGKASNPTALAKVFGFTSIPMAGSVAGLYRLSHSADPQTRLMAECALGRARILVPDETGKVFFAELESSNLAQRQNAYADLERLGTTLWGSGVLNEVALRVEPYWSLEQAWGRSTAHRGTTRSFNFAAEMRTGFVDPIDQRLIKDFGAAIKDKDPSVPLSCAKALILIGKLVDQQMNFGGYRGWNLGKVDIQRLLVQAANAIEGPDPALAKSARDLAVGFDRMRIVD